ncbi:MAG: thioredoxin family protein [Burkholderiaceae bacterium]|jgi:thiol:disulfide interchange protein DsbD|nr:thioredoxin family protein [Burkholderiaceae bacterium]
MAFASLRASAHVLIATRRLARAAHAGIAAAALALLGTGLTADAQAQPVKVDHAEAELVAATNAAVPGQPLQAGLRIKHEPHWHTYWRVPGDSGLPTTIKWTLPAGWQAGEIQWPVPKRLPVGPLMNYGYENELLLPVTLTPPADLAAGQTLQIAARADWLICADVCIPGGADLTLSLPVRDSAGPSSHVALFAATRAQIPQPLTLSSPSATIEGNRIRLAFAPSAAPADLQFFPLQEARIEAAAPQVMRSEDGKAALYLTAAQPVEAAFKSLSGVLVANGGPARADAGGWAGTIEVPLVAGTVAVVEGAAAAPAAGKSDITYSDEAVSVGLLGALIGAFIGGLILNLMPCVFPVLSLKLLSLLQHNRAAGDASSAHPKLSAHGWAFVGGVVLCFVLLAGVLIALRAGGAQLGWGFQLQTPWVVAALATLFFVIGLNLLGAFEFSFGGGLASSDLANRLQSDKVSGSFWTGVLAVVVAAPCTAPFMGAALGFAATQPAPIALGVFAVLGLGMATPYLVLTLFPALLRKLPRPGAWMERFKQVMAFPMFATAVWLLWVLAQQVDANSIGLALGALVLVGMAAWALGLAQRGVRGYRWVALGTAGLAVYAVLSATGTDATAAPESRAGAAGKVDSGAAWAPWSKAEADRLLAAGKPVFIDFTAAWCVTCQANKRLVLSRDSIAQAFAAKGVTTMRADWTNRDEEITRELARFKRNGVPLYVLYDGKGQARVLPELLTEGKVLEALGTL